MAAIAEIMTLIARVCRDGQGVELVAEVLVAGVIVLVESGNRLQADGMMVVVGNMVMELAGLTWELMEF